MFSSLFRKKPVGPPSEFAHRTLTAFDLIFMGIGAIIGAGVFVLTGVGAATAAGPGIVFSYAIAGTAALFAALAYAELAASVGGTGSAYSYAYAGFGEFAAWLIGWNLLLEYAMSVSTVAIGWAGYVNNLLQSMHINLPLVITKNIFEGGFINLLAVFIVLALGALLSLGVKQSARFNAVIVTIKLLTIALFIIIASINIDTDNWTPFLPFGWSGVMSGAALVFFAYIGFDALSTAVEDTINPQRDIPIGIIVSLIVCTLIYIAVALLLTGIRHYTLLNVGSPVSDALLHIGYRTAAGITAAGAMAGLTTVILIMYYGLTRVCLAMARDGLIPKQIAFINPRTHTPLRIIIVVAIIMCLVSGFAPIDRAAELVNIGTLAAFLFVCAGVMVFRSTHPDLKRPFKLPYNPLIPVLGILFCFYLMLNLPAITWFRFLIWTGIGVVIYFTYGKNHSLLQQQSKSERER
ncbi:MAG: amino acid permease [Gammaproteobacteria bacterium]|nr:amino acid permease [Gammaproteobacteria bacterium]